MRFACPTQTADLNALAYVPDVNIGLPNPQRNGHHGSNPHIRRTLGWKCGARRSDHIQLESVVQGAGCDWHL